MSLNISKTVLAILASSTVLTACKQEDKPVEAADTTALGTVAALESVQPEKLSDSLDLIFNPVKGASYRYSMTLKSEMIQTSPKGDTIKNLNDATYWYTKKVLDRPNDTTIRFSVRYDSMIVAATIPSPDPATGKVNFQTVRYNSNNKSDFMRPDFRQFSVLIGKEVTVTVNHKGLILDVQGLEAVVSEELEAQARAAKQKVDSNMIKGFALQVGTQAYKIPLQNEYEVFPSNPVPPAGQWSVVDEEPLLGAFPQTNTISFEFKGWKQSKRGKVGEITAVLNNNLAKKLIDNERVTLELKEHKVAGSGRHLFDQVDGSTLFREKEFVIMGRVKLTEKGQQPYTEERSQSIKTSIKVERL